MLSSQEKEIESWRPMFHQQSQSVKLGYRFMQAKDLFCVDGENVASFL